MSNQFSFFAVVDPPSAVKSASFLRPLDSRQANSDRGEAPLQTRKGKKNSKGKGGIGTNLSRGGGRKIGRRRRRRTNTFPTQKEKKSAKIATRRQGGRRGKKEKNGCSRFWFGPSRLLYPPFRFPPLRGPRASHTSSSRDYSYARWGSAPYSLTGRTHGQTNPRPLKEGEGEGGRPIHGFFSFLFRLFLAP